MAGHDGQLLLVRHRSDIAGIVLLDVHPETQLRRLGYQLLHELVVDRLLDIHALNRYASMAGEPERSSLDPCADVFSRAATLLWTLRRRSGSVRISSQRRSVPGSAASTHGGRDRFGSRQIDQRAPVWTAIDGYVYAIIGPADVDNPNQVSARRRRQPMSPPTVPKTNACGQQPFGPLARARAGDPGL